MILCQILSGPTSPEKVMPTTRTGMFQMIVCFAHVFMIVSESFQVKMKCIPSLTQMKILIFIFSRYSGYSHRYSTHTTFVHHCLRWILIQTVYVHEYIKTQSWYPEYLINEALIHLSVCRCRWITLDRKTVNMSSDLYGFI